MRRCPSRPGLLIGLWGHAALRPNCLIWADAKSGALPREKSRTNSIALGLGSRIIRSYARSPRTSAPAAGRPSPRASPALARPPPARSDPYHPLAVGGGGGLVRSPGRPDRGDRGARPRGG